MVGPRFLRTFFFLVTGNPGVRFRKYDKPTQSTFQQLFDSIGFLKEKDDTATLTTQGFVKIAQDIASETRNSTADLDGFTKAVVPHQLPYVYKNPNFPLTGINVVTLVTATSRVGGSGLDFLVQNTMQVSPAATPNNPIIVNQGNPGENVTLDLDLNLLPLDKVKVNASDPSASYLQDAVSSDNTCRLEITPAPGNDTLIFKYRDKIGEMTMYSATNVQFALDFPGNVGTGCWQGWVFANGSTYTNSLGNPVTVQDMRTAFPVGFAPAGLYPTIQDNQDSGGFSGENAHVLIANELAVHNHASGTLVNANGGAHTHDIKVDFNIVDGHTSGTAFNAVDPTQTVGAATMVTEQANPTTHTHVISGNTANAGAGAGHENRPPFGVVAFVVYIG